jgi:hypothetical protein
MQAADADFDENRRAEDINWTFAARFCDPVSTNPD